jgi:peptidoglycan/LPS O-acetylase OafA/YrhL
MNKSNSIDYLLIIRGLASLGVLFAHSRAYDITILQAIQQSFPNSSLLPLLSAIYPAGAGESYVMFFFILSGYLMGKIFFNNRYSFSKDGIKSFYKNRLLRIAPLLYFNLIICLGLFLYAYPMPMDILGNFLFINNILNPNGNIINPVTWSISYEMQYYLLAPFIYFAFKKRNILNFTILLILTAIFIFTTKYWGMFLAGFLVNYILYFLPFTKKIKYTDELVLILGFFGGNIVYFYFKNMALDTYANVSLMIIAMLSIYILELKSDQFTIGKIREKILYYFTWIGLLSYGIYLWHYPIVITNHQKVATLVEKIKDKAIFQNELNLTIFSQTLEILLTLVFTITISWMTYHLIETKFKPSIKG